MESSKIMKSRYKKSPIKKQKLQNANNKKQLNLKHKSDDSNEDNSDSVDEDEDSGEDDIEIKIASNNDNNKFYDNESNLDSKSGKDSSYDVLIKPK